MARDINDIVEENRRNINISQDSIEGVSLINISDGETPAGTIEKELGIQNLRLLSDVDYNNNNVKSNLILNNLSREIILDILEGNNSESVVKTVWGTGSSSSKRRSTTTLNNQISPNSESHSISISGDTLVIDSEANIDKNSDVSEIGIEISSGELIQYLNI